MASKRAVGTSLKLLARAFAGTVDEARVDVYFAALDDLSDIDLATATARVIKTHTGEFIPPPAVLRAAVAPAPTAVDAPGIIRCIEKLSSYSPAAGMNYPAVATVRAELGEQVAYAYAAAGGVRLFSENETTRDIAAREFQKAMLEANDRPVLPVIGPGDMDERAKRLVDGLTKQLGPGSLSKSEAAD